MPCRAPVLSQAPLTEKQVECQNHLGEGGHCQPPLREITASERSSSQQYRSWSLNPGAPSLGGEQWLSAVYETHGCLQKAGLTAQCGRRCWSLGPGWAGGDAHGAAGSWPSSGARPQHSLVPATPSPSAPHSRTPPVGPPTSEYGEKGPCWDPLSLQPCIWTVALWEGSS